MIELPANYHKLTSKERRQVREKYTRLQRELCYYCKEPLESKPPEWVLEKRVDRKLFPPNFFNNPIHLHHDHKTGKTIGTVHAYCNAVLWCHHGE